jgi:hypothetical protein
LQAKYYDDIRLKFFPKLPDIIPNETFIAHKPRAIIYNPLIQE